MPQDINKLISKFKKSLREENWRNDICPICKLDFKLECKHSIQDVKENLEDKLLSLKIRKELTKLGLLKCK